MIISIPLVVDFVAVLILQSAYHDVKFIIVIVLMRVCNALKGEALIGVAAT